MISPNVWDGTRPLRLGIDGEALRRPLSGVGQYVYQICAELEQMLPEAQFFVYSRLGADRLSLPSLRWRVRREPRVALRKLPSFLWLKTRGAAMCRADGIDVFWAGRTLHPRLGGGVRTISTVHDLNHLLVPQTMEWPTRWSHRLWFRGDLMHADIVLTNSQGTAQRLTEHLGVPTDDVLPPGVDPRFSSEIGPGEGAAQSALRALGIVPPYLLSVATLEPRKNVQTVLRAFLHMRRSGELPGHQLVLVGARGWRNQELEAELIAARGEGVLVTGYVGDELMPSLYRGADALVCASLYEGFGMPVLEARACGTPAVVSDLPELREAGGPLAIVVPPTVDGVCGGIRHALAHPRVVEASLSRVYSWRRNAQRLIESLRLDGAARRARELATEVEAVMEPR